MGAKQNANQPQTAEQLAKLLSGYSLVAAGEKRLQDTIEAVLVRESLDYKREFSFSRKDRIDFLLEHIGLEVKVDSSPAAVLRQLFRYSEQEAVGELLLVTTRSKHRNLPTEMNGKPVRVLYLHNL